MSQFNLGVNRSEPRHLVLVDEETGKEIGRMSGLEWVTVADAQGIPAMNVTYQSHGGTQDHNIEGPLKKVGIAQHWSGNQSAEQIESNKYLTEKLAEANNDMHELLVDNKKLIQRLTAVLRMMGGATTISDLEMGEAVQYGIEESWDPKNGTGLSLVEKYD